MLRRVYCIGEIHSGLSVARRTTGLAHLTAVASYTNRTEYRIVNMNSHNATENHDKYIYL